MKNGDRFYCKVCHEDSVVKVRKKMDGFRCTGEEFICMLCGAVLEPEPETPSTEGDRKERNPLEQLLGVEETLPERLQDDGTRHFCRDCGNYIHHPFLSRCDRFGKNVDPMDDCPAFVPAERPPQKNGSLKG